MVELETFLQVIPALSVVAALLYYSLTIRNMEKIRREDFIFQSNLARTPEYFDIGIMIIQQMWNYETLSEYNEKFSEEQRARHNWLINIFNTIGVAYKAEVASADEVCQLYPPHITISFFELSWP